MKLDSRIIKGKKPLDCFDIDIAKQFIGKKGFFGSRESQFMNLDSCPKCVVDELKEVDNYDDCPFMTSGNFGYKRFLPEEWVKEPKKKYRPYTLAEWIEQHEIGEVIHLRNKDFRQGFHVMYTGYVIDDGEDVHDIRTTGRIMLINAGYSLENLFEDYEIEMNGEWLPFGVIEE